jgi:hypothetical protein
VRIRSENWRAINEFYKALNTTLVEASSGCDDGNPLDVRWAIVVNYVDHTKEVLGLDPLRDCIQILSIAAPLHSSLDLLKYVERTFPFMK